ncbi:DUF397 domain-containing protein [Streptomyces sp. NPDC055607]
MNHPKPSAAELADARWAKSSYSGPNGNECVEVAAVRGWACLRDSKDAGGPAVAVSPQAFAAMLGAVESGAL